MTSTKQVNQIWLYSLLFALKKKKNQIIPNVKQEHDPKLALSFLSLRWSCSRCICREAERHSLSPAFHFPPRRKHLAGGWLTAQNEALPVSKWNGTINITEILTLSYSFLLTRHERYFYLIQTKCQLKKHRPITALASHKHSNNLFSTGSLWILKFKNHYCRQIGFENTRNCPEFCFCAKWTPTVHVEWRNLWSAVKLYHERTVGWCFSLSPCFSLLNWTVHVLQ